jgi:hypothetical protein
MGLLSWIKGRKSTGTATSITTTRATSADLSDGRETLVRDGVEVGDPAQQQAAVDEIDHLAHQFLTAGASSAASGGVTVMSSSSVFVDGQAVGADDPRARERMLEAVSQLRAQGFDELADDLEKQLGAAARAATDCTADDPGSEAAADALPGSTALAAPSAATTDASPESTAEAPEAPSAPAAPSPPPGPA